MLRARVHTKVMLYVPEPEAPTRLCQQLAQLAKGSALLDRRTNANDDDYALVVRIAFDCIPTLRRRIINALIRGDEHLAHVAPGATVKYCCDDLGALGLIESRRLSELSLELLELAKVRDFTKPPPAPSSMQ